MENVSKEQRKSIFKWLMEDLSRMNPSKEQMKEGVIRFNVSPVVLNRIIMHKRARYRYSSSPNEQQKNFVDRIKDEPSILQMVNRFRKKYYPEKSRVSIETYERLVKEYKTEPFMSPIKAIKTMETSDLYEIAKM